MLFLSLRLSNLKVDVYIFLMVKQEPDGFVPVQIPRACGAGFGGGGGSGGGSGGCD